VKDDGKRTLMYDLDRAIIDIRSRLPDTDPAVIALTSHYHNLLRRWAEL
jgi:PKHD-type hydroxylase